ncbi:MAG: hypothetical protein ACM34K_12465 [Bacillota bacterium]
MIDKACLKAVLILLLTFSAFSCSKRRDVSVTAAVYHWKSTFNLTDEEKQWIYSNNLKKLYLRVFDVDWNENLKNACPVGDVTIVSKNISRIEIIPAVFITNRTLINISCSEINTLSEKIINKVNSKLSSYNIRFNEIQFDCDWTDKTRDKYFSLLRSVKKLSSGKMISATIRLHQVKYFSKTGIPPADRGMLMFYNMGSVENIRTRNSIFDAQTAEKYLYNFDKYPLKLDVVLPAFSWGSLFRNGKLIALLNEMSSEELIQTGNFTQISSGQFKCKTRTAIRGNIFYENDIIKIETVSADLTARAAQIISEHIKENRFTLALYHLNKEVVKKYEKTKFENIISCFN